jgi:hypothetical protein
MLRILEWLGTLSESIMSTTCIGLNYIALCKLMFLKSLLRLEPFFPPACSLLLLLLLAPHTCM